MQEQKYSELETRATDSHIREMEERAEKGSLLDQIRKAEARSRVYAEIEAMRQEGKALTLTDEEISMLESFRRFKLRMRKEGEVFTWQTRRPEGVQLVEETANILHPPEA